ncbi:MAG: isoprenylcysteine carboxylmethyltransferase family protein [Candidatus Cloacimonetes bacterium]|nr:isoprenylcysteine carboxylmethyltransferase family protein [Candidatus Cloacimonadota bacterium]
MKRKIMPTTCLLLALILMVILHFAFPVMKLFNFPYNLSGLVPLAFGIYINFRADKQMKKHNTPVNPFEESTELIIDGAFAISRNPMYLGFSAILLGVFLLLSFLSTIIIVILFPILISLFYIKSEEDKLAKCFGNKWNTYSRQTGRWL